MNDSELHLNQIQAFLTGTHSVAFKPASQTESYQWIARSLKRFDYFKLPKGEKNLDENAKNVVKKFWANQAYFFLIFCCEIKRC